MSERVRSITVRETRRPAMTITRAALRAEMVVYLICSVCPQKYDMGRSRILYIGTTSRGAKRYSTSLSHKAIECLEAWGVRELNIHTLAPGGDREDKLWLTLESDLLRAFKARYGTVPLKNTSGKNYRVAELSGAFTRRRLDSILAKYETMGGVD